MKTLAHIKVLTFLLVLFSVGQLSAQSEQVPDNRMAIIHLKNGNLVEGEIIDWNFGESITIKFPWGATTKFQQYEIKKITQKSAKANLQAPYSFKENGIYYNVRTHIIAGNDGQRANGVFGTGVSLSAGHRFNRWFSLGGGIGYDRFIWESGENLIPIFAEVTGFFNPKNTSLFYNLQSGYSFASTDEQYLLIEAKGGFMVYPNIGIRWGHESTSFLVSFGYKFQNAEFTYANPWNFGETSRHDILYKRMTLGFGVTL